MAAQAETLTAAPQAGAAKRHDLVARIALAVKEWGRKGQLGNATSEMRSYTGSR